MVNHASLQSSIQTAVDQYETYKSQSLRLNLDSLSLGTAPSSSSPSKPTHNKRASLSIPALQRLGSKDSSPAAQLQRPKSNRPESRSSNNNDSAPRPGTPTGAYSAFIRVARNHENATFLVDLDFLFSVLDFIRTEHPHSSNSLKVTIKQRQMQKKKLWTRYTTQMQGLAKSYASGQVLRPDLDYAPDTSIASRRQEIKALLSKMQAPESVCGQSLLSALDHNHAQAITDIDARYAMPDPLHDKVTPVERHNERVRIFNQLVKFVADDLGKIEKDSKTIHGETPALSKKDKRGSGARDAIESLRIDDYPPYK